MITEVLEEDWLKFKTRDEVYKLAHDFLPRDSESFTVRYENTFFFVSVKDGKYCCQKEIDAEEEIFGDAVSYDTVEMLFDAQFPKTEEIGILLPMCG